MSERTLAPETAEQRAQKAIVGAADIAQCRARMAALKTPGKWLDKDGNTVTTPAAVVRAMLEAEAKGE